MSKVCHDRLTHCNAKSIHKLQSYIVIAYDCLNALLMVIELEQNFCFGLGDVQSEVLNTIIKRFSTALDIILSVFN